MSVKDIVLPEIGEGVNEGEMVKWLVKVGDSVEVDQSIVEVMTDKATVEVPSPIAGVVKELKAKEGEMVSVESTLLVLDTAGARVATSPLTQEGNSNQSSQAPPTIYPPPPIAPPPMEGQPIIGATTTPVPPSSSSLGLTPSVGTPSVGTPSVGTPSVGTWVGNLWVVSKVWVVSKMVVEMGKCISLLWKVVFWQPQAPVVSRVN